MLRDSKKRASFWWTVQDEEKTTSVLVPVKFKNEFLHSVSKKGMTKQDYDNWMVSVDNRYPKASIFDRLGKTNTIIIAVAIALFGFFVIGAVVAPKDGSSRSSRSSQKSYSNMSESERKAWYEKFKLSTEGIELKMKIVKNIENSYKYPETVEIQDESYLMWNAKPEDLSKGKYVIHFKTVAQNAFGVKIRSSGTVKFTATPEKSSLDNITINE